MLSEKNILEELYVDTVSRSSVLGNIYKGRVVNVEPSIGAAFVDFGTGRNGFLHASDVLGAYGDPAFELTDLPLAKAGEDEGPEAVRAVVDDPDERRERQSRGEGGRGEGGEASLAASARRSAICSTAAKRSSSRSRKMASGMKGSTLTTYISIPGRSLVLMPSLPRCGVSRKINDDKEAPPAEEDPEGDRPRSQSWLHRPDGGRESHAGRAPARSRLPDESVEVFKKRLATGRAPLLMYEESDLVHHDDARHFHSRDRARHGRRRSHL